MGEGRPNNSEVEQTTRGLQTTLVDVQATLHSVQETLSQITKREKNDTSPVINEMKQEMASIKSLLLGR